MATGQKTQLRSSLMLNGLQSEQMKVHIETISGSDLRIKEIYEANADTDNGQECIKTVYVYNGTSDLVLYAVEIKAIWDSTWDDDAEAIAQAAIPPYSIEG